MMPLFASTRRMRLLSRSAMKRFPSGSNAMVVGAFSVATVAGPLSPPKPEPPEGHGSDASEQRDAADDEPGFIKIGLTFRHGCVVGQQRPGMRQNCTKR